MDRRKFLVGLGSASVGGSALLGSGAFSRVEAQRDVTIAVAEDPDAYLGLDKCPGSANNSYAHLDDHGHLRIYMDDENPTIGDSPLGSGVNSDSTTWFDQVFQICNQGKQAVCLWIEDHEDWPETDEGERRVEFYYEDNDQNSIIGEENRVTLNVGDCVCVGIKTRTYGLSDGDELLGDLENEIRLIATVECFEEPECAEEEVMYLTNSSPPGGSGTQLLTVDDLDDSQGEARLTAHQTVNGGTFNQVDSLAATPDGDWLYFYDRDSGHLGRLDTTDLSGTLEDLGQVENPSGSDPSEVVLGAFSPDGTLYAVGQGDDKLWEIDPNAGGSNPQATEIGPTGIDALGSDIVFDLDSMYLHSNAESPDLHSIDVNTGDASPVCDVGEKLTGLAIREGGIGDIIASVSEYPGADDGEIIRFDPNDCSISQRYTMMLDGDVYQYESGDMATGPRCVSNGGFGTGD